MTIATAARGARRGSLLTAGGMGLSAAAMLLANALVLTSSSLDVFADLAVTTVVVTVAATFLRFGSDRIFIGEFHQTQVHHGTPAALRVGSDLLGMSLLFATGGAALVLFGPLAWLLEQALTSPLSTPERGLCAVWLACDVVRLTSAEGHRARHRFGRAAISSYGLRAPLFALTIAVSGTLMVDLPRDALLAMAAGASLITAVISLGSHGADFRWWRSRPWRTARSALLGHSAMVTTTLAATLIGGADVWIVGVAFSGEETARYAFAVTLVGGLVVLSSAVNGGLSPYIARALASGQTKDAQRRTVRYVRVTAAFSLALYGGIVLLGEPLAVLLGGVEYRGVGTFLAILGAGQVISTIAGLSGYVLTLGRRYLAVSISSVSVAAVTVLLGLAAALWFDSILLLAIVSGSATGALPLVNNALAAKLLDFRTDALATVKGHD